MTDYVLIYLHGFLSSAQSQKATDTIRFIEQHYPQLNIWVPDLPNYPQQAIDLIESRMDDFAGKKLRFIGSSMGGYLSTYLTEKYQAKSVLINPAVRPYELLADYLGSHINPYTLVEFSLDESHVTDLLALDTQALAQPQNYMVLLQTGDETLDYRLAETKYKAAKLLVEEGGDHSFQGFARHLPAIMEFLLAE